MAPMSDIFGLDTLVAQMVLALGAALLIGNGYALLMSRRGVRPKGARGELRRSRAIFLVVIGAVTAWWGLGSLLTS
jgi:hypothetical protein